MRAGELSCLAPGRAHAYGSSKTQPWDILWVHFNGPLASTFFDILCPPDGSHLILGLDTEIRNRWIELVRAHRGVPAGRQLRVNTGLCGLLGLLGDRRQQKCLRYSTKGSSLDPHDLERYVDDHLAEPIQLVDLARQTGLSPTHFCRVFKKHFGISPIDYLIQARLSHACSLLGETSLAVKQISAAVAYEDPYYFSRLFRHKIGCTPTEYRRRQQETLT